MKSSPFLPLMLAVAASILISTVNAQNWVFDEDTQMWIDTAATEDPTDWTEEPTDASTQERTDAFTQEPTDAPTQESTDASTQETTEGVPNTTSGSCPGTRERWPWRLLSCSEQDTYLDALEALKQSGVYDDFVRTHIWMADDSHGVDEFLPWHRWYIYQFENAIREVSQDPCITLPYWDWEQDAGDESDSLVFDRATFGWYERDCNWRTENSGCLRREYNGRFDFWSIRRVLGLVTSFDQYTDDWRGDSRRTNGFRAALEGSCHAAPHQYIGEDMDSMRSPNDPLFFLHHANVDRIWAIWQDWNGHSRMSASEYDAPEHYSGRIDRELDFPGFRSDQSWDFRLNGNGYPTSREVLSNSDNIRVRYMEDQMARTLEYGPNPDWFDQASTTSIEVACPGSRRRDRERNLQAAGRHHGNPAEVEASFPVASLRGRNNGGNMLSYFKKEQEQIKQQEGIDIPSPSFSLDEPTAASQNIASVEDCLEINRFSRQDDRDDWDRLCREMPLTATYAERLAEMAKEECEAKGNPFGATLEWIQEMKMTDEVVAFECFHLPDRFDG
ncbi:MAG: hypothetical protein SGILL_000120 [Bacillariaceae sp.]